MPVFAIINNLRVQDVLDILFLTVVAYHLYLWFRGTKALKALIGLLVLGFIFTVARTWGLFLTTWVFHILWQVLVLLLIILFQSEIRQALERVNPLHAIGFRKISRPEKWIPDFAQAVFALARKKIGALVIIERGERVREFTTEGQALEGTPGPELIMSIFHKESPLHDGAVLIRGGRITQAACYLPLTPDEGLPKHWGTRHRAALGLTGRCDACVVVVSEERGEVSLAREKQMTHVDDPQRLQELIQEMTAPAGPSGKTRLDRLRLYVANRWQLKLGALFLVSLLWLLLAGQQDFEATIQVPLRLVNIPPGMEVVEPVDPVMEIRVRGLRKDASTLSDKDVTVQLDLSTARPGETVFPVGRGHVRLPSEGIQFVKISPPQITFTFRERK